MTHKYKRKRAKNIVNDYRNGVNLSALVDKYLLGEQAICTVLRKAGCVVKTEIVYSEKRLKKKPSTPAANERRNRNNLIVAAYRDGGKRMIDLAHMFDVSKQRILQILQANGINPTEIKLARQKESVQKLGDLITQSQSPIKNMSQLIEKSGANKFRIKRWAKTLNVPTLDELRENRNKKILDAYMNGKDWKQIFEEVPEAAAEQADPNNVYRFTGSKKFGFTKTAESKDANKIIVDLVGQGFSYEEIATFLNDAGIKTLRHLDNTAMSVRKKYEWIAENHETHQQA